MAKIAYLDETILATIDLLPEGVDPHVSIAYAKNLAHHPEAEIR